LLINVVPVVPSPTRHSITHWRVGVAPTTEVKIPNAALFEVVVFWSSQKTKIAGPVTEVVGSVVAFV
jgi:hypothetical protein